MAPLLTTEAARGLLNQHRQDGSHTALFLGATTSNILNIPAASKLLYNIELCKKAFLDELRAIFMSIFTWLLNALSRLYPAFTVHEERTISGKILQEPYFHSESSSVCKQPNEIDEVLGNIVISSKMGKEHDSTKVNSVPRTNIQSTPSTAPLEKRESKMSSLQTSSQFETCNAHKEAGPVKTIVISQSVPKSTTKHVSSLHFLFGMSVLSDLTPRKIGPCAKAQVCTDELSCNLVMKTSHVSKEQPKVHEYSNCDIINLLSLIDPSYKERYGHDCVKVLDLDLILKMYSKHMKRTQTRCALYRPASNILSYFDALDCKDILETLKSGSEETGRRLRDKLNEKHFPIVSKPELLLMRDISKYAIYNTNNSNVKQCLQGQVDIQKVACSVYNSVLQRYETEKTMQAALASRSGNIIDWIANTIIIEITHHLQPLLKAEPSSSSDNIVEEVLGDLTADNTTHPLSGQSKDSLLNAVYSDAFLEDVISGVLSKIVVTANTTHANPEMMPECKLNETAIQLIYPLLEAINESQLKVVHINTNSQDQLPNQNHVRKVVESVCRKVLEEFGSPQAVEKALHCNHNRFSERICCLLLARIPDYQIQLSHSKELCPHQYVTLEASNIVQKVQNDVKKLRQRDMPFSPLTTMLSSKVLDDIVVILISKIFPSTGNINACTGNLSSLSDSEFSDMVSKLTHEVMMEISNHEIWYTQDATYIQCVHSQKDVPNEADSVCKNILVKYGTRLDVQDKAATGSRHSVKRLSRLLIREISNPSFTEGQPVVSRCTHSSGSTSCVAEHILCGLYYSKEQSQATDQTSVSLLDEILSGILSKIFFIISDQIMKEKDTNTSIAQLNKKVESFVNSLLKEIEKTQFRFKEEKQTCPAKHQSVVDLIVNSISCNIFQEYENGIALYTCLTQRSNVLAGKIVCLVKAAASDHHLEQPTPEEESLCAFTTLDSKIIVLKVVNSVIEARNQDKPSVSCPLAVKVSSSTSVKADSVLETVIVDTAQPYHILQPEATVLSSTVLEEIVATFLCKLFFNCPNLSFGTKDISSVHQVKIVTEKLLNALLIIISEKQIHFSQDTSETRYVHPKDNEVIEKVVKDVYSNVYHLSGSHVSVYENLMKKEDLVHTVAGLMIAEISNYQFQPCYPHGKLTDKYMSTQSSHIVQRVLNDMRGMPPYSQLLESSSHVLYAPFLEEIVRQFLTKMFMSSNYLQIARTRSISLEAELSKVASHLINTVLKEMQKSEINVIKPANDGLCLHPEDEDFIAVVVDSVYMNALRESGSPFKLFKAIISGCTGVSERIAVLVIKELSKFQLQPFPASCVSCDAYTDLEVSKIVDKVFTHVAAQSALTANVENIVHSITHKITDSREESEDQLPIIIPHIQNEPLKIDPGILVDHLAVFSIKTEPLEILEKRCLLQTGKSLELLRRDCIYGKDMFCEIINATPLSPEFGVGDNHQKRALLDKVGRIDVKPKKLFSRNSFFNVLKPDMTKVELLKDVKTKKEVLVRLVAHNIGPYDEDNDIKEEVIKAEPCKLLIAEKTCLQRCCGSCSGGDSTKTKKSHKASKNTQKEKGGDVLYLNKNSCASCADKNGENRNCIIDVLHYMNSDPVNEYSPQGLNSNANSVTCEAGYRSDVSRQCFALDSSLSRCSLKTSHVESSKSSLLKRRGPHILQYPPMLSFQQMPHSSSVGNKCHLPFRRKDLKSNLITAKVEPETGKQKLPYLPVRLFQPFPQCSCVLNNWCLRMRRKDTQCNKMSSKTEAGK